jgi:hypothetical protein
MFVTTELLADAPGVRRSGEGQPLQIPGTRRVLFFFLRLMYVTKEEGRQPGSLERLGL